jgi:hypothetical protein
VTLREAFGILSLSEKDLDPRALEGVLTTKLETAEFHDIPKLLEAYRTVNSLLETQLWYWNPETTSIHHQDGSTIELRGASASVGVMTAPPPAVSVPQNPAKNLPEKNPPEKNLGDPDEVELITEAAPPPVALPPVAPSPATARSAVPDDAPLIVDDEIEGFEIAPQPPQSPLPSKPAAGLEESVRLAPKKPAPPEPAKQAADGNAKPRVTSPRDAAAPALRPATPPRVNRAATALDPDDDIDETHSTMVVVPPRRNTTAPWMVAAAAVGLVGVLWVLQSQAGRVFNRNPVVPTPTQSRTAVPAVPMFKPPAPPVATSPSAPSTVPQKPAQKPVQKPVTATTKPPAPSAPPQTPVAPKPTTAAVSPAPSKPTVSSPAKPTNPPVAVIPAKPSSPPPAPSRPVAPVAKPITSVAKPIQPSAVATKPPVSKVPSPKPVTSTPGPQPSPTPKPSVPVAKPVAKPVVQATAKPLAPVIPTRPETTTRPAPKPSTIRPKPVSTTIRPKPVSVPAPVAVIEAPKNTGLPDNLTREEYGRRYFNQKIYEVWQRSNAQLRYGSWEAIPLEIQTLPSSRFRAAVYIAPALEFPK